MLSTAISHPDVSRASLVTVPTIVTTAIAVVLTALRVYVRLYVIKRPGWDDFFNVLATITMMVVMGLTIESASNGFGRHVEYLDHAHAVFSVKILRIAELTLILCTIFVKISISLFLERLFATNKARKTFLIIFIAFNTITSMVDAIIIFPQCTPVARNWDRSVEGHCWSQVSINAIGIVQGAIAAGTDIVLSFLPIVFLWNLHLKTKYKIGVCGIMALGFASGGFAIERTILVPSLTTTSDPTWDLVDLFMWANLEATFGVIAAAVPAVRPLFGYNSLSPRKRRTKPPSPLVPLHSFRTECTARRSWYLGEPYSEHHLPSLKTYASTGDPEDIGGTSDSESDPARLDAPHEGIMKTTDVLIKHEQASSKDAGASR